MSTDDDIPQKRIEYIPPWRMNMAPYLHGYTMLLRTGADRFEIWHYATDRLRDVTRTWPRPRPGRKPILVCRNACGFAGHVKRLVLGKLMPRCAHSRGIRSGAMPVARAVASISVSSSSGRARGGWLIAGSAPSCSPPAPCRCANKLLIITLL
jgi:hypothetical protein